MPRDAAGGLVYRAGVPSVPDHLFAVLLAVLFPIRAALFGYRRLSQAEAQDVPRVRMWLYRQGIAIQWSLTAVAIALWVWHGRPWALLGVVPRLTWALLGVAVGLAVIVPIVLVQRRKALDDEEALLRLRERMRHIERMMPRSGDELRWFGGLALTAGICEELLYRGYLIWYLTTWMAIVPAVVVASAVFGLGHLYQGARGVALTAGVGVFMSAVYLLTGSLFACMAIHALMDLHAGHMAHAAFQREEEAPVPAVSEPAG